MSSSRNYGPTGAGGTPYPVQNVQAGTSKLLPAQLVGNVTTEQVLLNATLSAPGAAVPLTVVIPSGSILEQQPFEVSASGYIKAGAAGNVTVNLYEGSSATVGNDTLLKSSGAVSYAGAATSPFYALAKLIYDSVSGKLTGTVKFLINNTLVAEAAVTNVVTGVNDQNNPVVSFLLSFTFSVANAANLVNLQDLAINY